MQSRKDGRAKDPLANLRHTGEFTVNMVDPALAPALAPAMTMRAMTIESVVDDLTLAGLPPVAANPPEIRLLCIFCSESARFAGHGLTEPHATGTMEANILAFEPRSLARPFKGGFGSGAFCWEPG